MDLDGVSDSSDVDGIEPVDFSKMYFGANGFIEKPQKAEKENSPH